MILYIYIFKISIQFWVFFNPLWSNKMRTLKGLLITFWDLKTAIWEKRLRISKNAVSSYSKKFQMQLPPFVYRFLINEIRLPLLCTNSTFLIEKEGFVCTKLGELVLKTSSSTLCSNVGPVQLEISQHGGEKVWQWTQLINLKV